MGPRGRLGVGSRSPKVSALISYGNKTTKGKFDRLKTEARNDLRKFSTNKLQRTCGIQPLNSVRVLKQKGKFRHDSTIVCKNRQTCPWCTPPHLAAQRTTINAKAIHALDMGGFVLSSTLTLPKRNAHDLEYSYKLLLAQITRFRRLVTPIEKRFGIRESFRTLEETFSEVSFWHPHVNYCWLIDFTMAEETLLELQEALLEAWLKSASNGQVRGVQIAAQKFNTYRSDSSVKKLSRYITKHSYFPSSAPEKSARGTYLGLQPWDILNLARSGEVFWVQTWQQYERAMKRKRRVVHYKNT